MVIDNPPQTGRFELLSSEDVAVFVARGYLRFEAVVPPDINEMAVQEMRSAFERWRMVQTALTTGEPLVADAQGLPALVPFGTPLSEAFSRESAYGRLLELPVIAGAIRSLMGRSPIVHDHFAHVIPAHHMIAQRLHSDTPLGMPEGFAIQLFWYPHDVAPDAGGTRFVPGSHLRHLRHEEVARYKHLVGEDRFSGPAGTVVVVHHALWHAATENPTSEPRVMGKLRLQPTEPQVRLWDTGDLDRQSADVIDRVAWLIESEPAHLVEPGAEDLAARIASTIRERQPWHDSTSQYAEVLKRHELFRELCGRA